MIIDFESTQNLEDDKDDLTSLQEIDPKLCNINLHNVIPSLISQNPRERMFLVQNFTPHCHISLHYIMVLTLMQTTKEVKPYSHIAPHANIGTPKIYQNGGSTPILQNHQHIMIPKDLRSLLLTCFLPLFSLSLSLQRSYECSALCGEI